jgi:hypothetical protein
MLGYYKVVTNYRTMIIEAAGIGDAIDRALNLILDFNGEFIRSVEAEQALELAA